MVGNPHLPEIEPIDELDYRNAKEIAERILVLGYIYALTFDVEIQVIKEELVFYNLNKALSDYEKKLLSKSFLSKQEKADISWLPEAIEVLGWAIGLWTNILFMEQCDEDRQADNIPIKQDPDGFYRKAKLISKVEIYKMADLMYRMHWIAKRREIGNLGTYSNDVYMERHKAINWIIGINNNWDEIQTDT